MQNTERTRADKIIVWSLIAAVVLMPLVFYKAVFSVFALPKLLALKVIMVVLVTAWAWKLIKEKKVSYYASKINRPFVAYALLFVVTTVFSRYPLVSLIGAQGRFMGFLAFAGVITFLWCARQFLTKEETIQLTVISLVTSLIVSLYSLFLWSGIVDTSEWSMDPTDRVFGTLGHGNHLGAYIGFHYALLIGVWPYIEKKWLKGIFLVGLIPMTIVLFATGSRGALIATLAGFFVMAILWLLRIAKQNPHSIKKWLLRSGMSILVIGVVIFLAHAPLWDRLQKLEVVQRTMESIEFWKEGHIPDRVSWWLSTIEMVKDRPFLGSGLSSYKEIYNQYRRTDYRVPGEEQDTLTPESAHMEFFTIAAEQGLIGVCVYIWLLWAIFARLIRMIRNPETLTTEMRFALGVAGALTIYVVQSMMSFGVLGTLVPFMIFLGIAWAWTGSHEKQVTHRWSTSLAWCVALTLVIANLWSFVFTIKQTEAEYYTFVQNYDAAATVMPYEYYYFGKLGEQAFGIAVSNQDQEKVKKAIEIAVRAYEKAVELGPTQPYLWMNLGVSYYTAVAFVKDLDPTLHEEFVTKALDAYKKAVELGPNDPLYPYNYGKAQLLIGNVLEAQTAFEQTLAIRDPYQDTYVLLGAAYEALGLKDSALEYAKKEVALDPTNEDAQQMVKRLSGE